MLKKIQLLICLTIILLFYFVLPVPKELTPHAWQLTGIFISTILAIIFKVLPLGSISMIAVAFIAISNVTVFETQVLESGEKIIVDAINAEESIKNALSSFSNPLIWLIGASIMVSKAIIKTGLGSRIAYYLISVVGSKTIFLAYSLVFSETLLAPVTPSNTARGGGIIHTVTKAICHSFDPKKEDNSKISTFLTLVNFQTNPITSTMFITATAPNPLMVDLVAKATNSNIHISWGEWAIGMFLPSIVCLLVMPLVIYCIEKPKIINTPNAKEFAKEKLKELGKMGKNEYITLFIFILLLILWAGTFDFLFGIKINATTTAFIGLALVLATKVLTWEEVLAEKTAWDTIVWFSSLVMMATYLNKMGVTGLVSKKIETFMFYLNFDWKISIIILSFIFLYTHYFFASTTAHISAMFLAFYSVGITLGAPPLVYAFLLIACANLMMALTHYATGTAPVIFGSGFATIKQWWRAGFIVSFINFLIFLTIGGIWWKFLGYW